MCDPLTVIAATAMIAGTGMQMAGASQAQAARNSAFQSQARLQAEHQQQEQAAFENSLAMAQPDKIKQDEANDTAQRAAMLVPTGAAAQPISLPGQGTGMSEATRNSVVADSQKANTDATGVAMGRAAMGGTADALRTAMLGMAPNAARIANEATMSRMDANLLPYELASADRQGAGLRSIGSLISGLGSAGLGAGAGSALGLGARGSASGLFGANGALGSFSNLGDWLGLGDGTSPWGMRNIVAAQVT